MIAALFVETDGCYFNLPNVDPWDITRDARKYHYLYPVVAHPPCQRWGALGAASYARWGGDHNLPGNDGGCFLSAFMSVNASCGVLEHPAKTNAFASRNIQIPRGIGWKRHFGNPVFWQENFGDGFYYVCEVWQSAYGHKANKATWLYYVGKKPPFDLDWSRPKGTHQIGFQDQRGKEKNKPTLSKKDANATPPAFRDVLIRLAEHSRG
jgi:hypothetical protein